MNFSDILNSPLLDENQLRTLQSLNDEDCPDLVGELIDIFIASTPDSIKALEESLKEGSDYIRIEKCAHKLKGSSSNLGAEKLRAICAHIEEGAREKTLETDIDFISPIKETYEVLIETLNKNWRLKP